MGLHLWGFLQLLSFCHTWWHFAGSRQSTQETPPSAWRIWQSKQEPGSLQEGAWVAVSENCKAVLLHWQFCYCWAGRGVQKVCLQAPKGTTPVWKMLVVYCEVTNFDEPKETELTFCKTWGLGSSPFLPQNSQPALFDMRPYWYSYFCRTMMFYVADHFTVNVYCILVCSRVWRLP